MKNRIFELFNEKPIIGKIDLAGEEKIEHVLKKISNYQEEGVNAAIIEDCYCSRERIRIIRALKEIQEEEKFKLIMGVNVLRDPPHCSFELAKNYGAKFVQFDNFQTNDFNTKEYDKLRDKYSDIIVLGGVRFNAKQSGNSLEKDLEKGMSRCDAIVTTGDRTRIETPIDKLKKFKKIMGKYPLILYVGVNKKNIYEQLPIVDGVIVGSSYVRDLMSRMNKLRSS
jgi:predicted TIM-barrel enzyme